MLVLYVFDDDRSPACHRARETVRRALGAFPEDAVELVVRDLSKLDALEQTAEDRAIVLVPTLVLVEPGRAYVTGELTVERVVELLVDAGVAPRRRVASS